jgi:hypothetical protein
MRGSRKELVGAGQDGSRPVVAGSAPMPTTGVAGATKDVTVEFTLEGLELVSWQFHPPRTTVRATVIDPSREDDAFGRHACVADACGHDFRIFDKRLLRAGAGRDMPSRRQWPGLEVPVRGALRI